MWKWMRHLGTTLDRHAVALAAAVVGWIVAAAILVPYAPAVFTESPVLGVALKGTMALVAFGLARRYL